MNRWIFRALMLVVLPSSSEAAKAWLAIDSPHFTVISSETKAEPAT